LGNYTHSTVFNNRVIAERKPPYSTASKAANKMVQFGWFWVKIGAVKTEFEQIASSSLHIRDCGLADYHEILQLQHELRDKRRRDEIPNTVLIVEHKPVITLGARQSANKLLAEQNLLAEKHIEVVETRRGGGATAHNPGQLVFYPILHLGQLDLDISEYMRQLEAIGAELLEQLGLASGRRKGFPGLWVEDRKIASIGARVSRQVTYHGMAINIQNDLSIFDLLIPCGLEGVEMTSVLKETGERHSMGRIKKDLAKLLVKHFSKNIKPARESGHVRRATGDVQRKLPPWLYRPLPANERYNHTKKLPKQLGLETICHNANCPNFGECWSRGTATVLILGNTCTRNCRFCSVATGKGEPPESTEPERLAEMAKMMGLKYLVITSVNRDDLPDGGAGHFRECINTVRRRCPDVKFEILTPDFRNCQAEAIDILAEALPFVFAHNVEMVPSLYRKARAGGDYQRSLNLLKMAKERYNSVPTKSSIMLGLGETDTEVELVLRDLRRVGCERITIGQYLRPSKDSLEVDEYIRPDKFDIWRQKAIELGFSWVISSPFARSSYFAEQQNAR
jgi:lipoic acid synthetase